MLAAKLSEQQRRALSKNGKKPSKVCIHARVPGQILFITYSQTCLFASVQHGQLIAPGRSVSADVPADGNMLRASHYHAV